MRVVARKRRGERRRVRLKRVVFLGLVGVVLAVGLGEISGPLARLRERQGELSRLRERKAAMVAEQSRLERYKRRLATEGGQEEAARRQGYVREGERRLVFVREQARDEEGVGEGRQPR